jgi:serine/threonine protein kinase
VTRYEGSWLRGTELWIVMEYLSGGSCGDLLKPGVFREEYIAIILRELLKGLEYLHGEGKLHRDIKGMAIGFTKLSSLRPLTQSTFHSGKRFAQRFRRRCGSLTLALVTSFEG